MIEASQSEKVTDTEKVKNTDRDETGSRTNTKFKLLLNLHYK